MSEPFVPGDSDYNILKKILQNQAGPYPFVNGDSDYNILRKILMNQYAAVVPEATTTEAGAVRLSTIVEQRNSLPNGVISPNGPLNAYRTQQELLKDSSNDVLLTVARSIPSSILTAVSGTLYLVPFIGVSGTVASMSISPNASAVGVTLAKMGIYSVSNWVHGFSPSYTGSNLLASTASFTIINATGVFVTHNLTSPLALVEGSKYFAAILQVGATPATLLSSLVGDSNSFQLAPQLALQLTGQADIPASLDVLATSGSLPSPRIYLNLTT